MKYAIIVFPGSNCDQDAYFASEVSGARAIYLWHKDTEIPADVDCVILPGGFSYGDYLRCGAIARFSPIMKEVVKFADRGGLVLGVCNGFQILTEVNLLPGVLLRNDALNFICKDVHLKTMNNPTPFTSKLQVGEIITIPIAHGEGNYFADEDALKMIEDNEQIAFKYCDANGEITKDANPNGSVKNIAGVANERGNVLGMMPHPERYCDKLLGRDEGLAVFDSINNYLK